MKISINLLPIEKKEEQRFRERCHMVLKLVMMASLAVVVYIMFIASCWQIIEMQKRAVDNEVAGMRENKLYRQVREDQEVIKEYYKMAGMIESGLSHEKKYLPVFEMINHVTADGIVYDQIRIDAKGVLLKGEGKERQEVIELKSKLEQAGIFSKVDSPISNLTQDKEVTFEFKLEFKTATK